MTMTEIIDGKKIKKEKISELKNSTFDNLSLGVVQVGENEASKSFIKAKARAAKTLGIGFSHYGFPAHITFSDLKNQIERLPDDGLIVQLPIEGDLKKREREILDLIPFEKDVDVLAQSSLGKYYTGNLEIYPPTVGAIRDVLDFLSVDLKGKRLVIVGPGKLIGKPAAVYGIRKKATISIVTEFTNNPKEIIKKGEVIITGVGKPGLIDKSMVNSEAIVIDGGTTKSQGELKGDVDFESVKGQVKAITPVPGGIGPLTVANLFENLIVRHGN